MTTLYCQSLWKAGLPSIWFEAVSTPPPPPWPLWSIIIMRMMMMRIMVVVVVVVVRRMMRMMMVMMVMVTNQKNEDCILDLVVMVVNEDQSMHPINHPPTLDKQEIINAMGNHCF